MPAERILIKLAQLAWPEGRTEQITLTSTGKSGGAGEIFAIDTQPHLVAKVYHSTTTPPQLEHYRHKIQWMLNHRPTLPQIPAEYQGIVQLAWPEALILHESRFIGFAMRKIAFDRTLELDYLLNRRQASQEDFDIDYGKLVAVCFNLAAIISCLHSMRIAIVDLKPMNVKVYKSELFVSILDCDGFHIATDEFCSDAPQVTPDYLAPEFQGGAVTHPEAQDRFALATIIFRLLNYGIHPFSGVGVNSRDYPPELAGRIRDRLYPYGTSAHKNVRKVPASVHEALPNPLRELFDRAFSALAINRPSAHEWVGSLSVYAVKQSGQMLPCSRGHLKFSSSKCPTCLRDQLIEGATARRRSFLARMQAAPSRTLKYVKKTLRQTHTSPFQAALAQTQFAAVHLAPRTLMSTRNAIAAEILWVCGLVISYWWTQ